MQIKTTQTYYAEIYMAGDIDHCKQALTQYVTKGASVTVTPTEYIYTGGRELGFIIGLINYPKFPRTEQEIDDEALTVADYLIKTLGQDSASILTPKHTTLITKREAE